MIRWIVMSAAVVEKRMREWLGGINGGYWVVFERVVRFPGSAYWFITDVRVEVCPARGWQ